MRGRKQIGTEKITKCFLNKLLYSNDQIKIKENLGEKKGKKKKENE